MKYDVHGHTHLDIKQYEKELKNNLREFINKETYKQDIWSHIQEAERFQSEFPFTEYRYDDENYYYND